MEVRVQGDNHNTLVAGPSKNLLVERLRQPDVTDVQGVDVFRAQQLHGLPG